MYFDAKLKGITCDSRKVKPGYAFVAVKGEKEDGNSYIEEAIAKGAAVIFTEEDLKPLPFDVPVVKVENARLTLARLLARFYKYPSEKINVIGVTGTNGKTTTTYMIEEILRKAGFSTGLIGTVSMKIGSRYYPHTLTTPDSECLQRALAQMVEQDVYAAVMEVSSHGLKYHRVDCIDFNVAVHTNISEDHIDTHGSFEDYVNTKRRLFNMLGSGTTAVINGDDPHGLDLVRENPKPLILTYGLGAKSSITASSIDTSSIGASYTCCVQRSFTNMVGNDVEPQEIPLKLKVPGKHNVYNSLAATTVGLLYGVEPQVVQSALTGFNGVWRRMQIVYEEGFTVIDDFSHNPGSYEAVFETVQAMNYNDIHILSAIRGNRGPEINRANGKVIASWAGLLGAEEIIVTSSSDTVGDGDRVTMFEREAFLSELNKAGTCFVHFDTLEKAIEEVLQNVQKGDIVLLMGAQGMNRGQDILFDKLNRVSKIKKKDITALPFEYLCQQTDKSLHK
ncbi:MAG: UDP-N-acetylmuramyl-tripeptide synthetase [Bacillota bacterium]|nr:UDP-N-acetylmuramyl-tripeptide synthetase [Bacillota bacterium]